MDEFRDLGDGYGLLVEGSQYYTGVFAFQLARRDGAQAKEAMSKLGRMADFLFIIRDHVGGRGHDRRGRRGGAHVRPDRRARQSRPTARACASWRSCTRPPAPRRCGSARRRAVWKRGDDVDAWVDELHAMHIGAGGLFMG